MISVLHDTTSKYPSKQCLLHCLTLLFFAFLTWFVFFFFFCILVQEAPFLVQQDFHWNFCLPAGRKGCEIQDGHCEKPLPQVDGAALGWHNAVAEVSIPERFQGLVSVSPDVWPIQKQTSP